MKVLVITSDFIPNPGGIAIFLHNLCLQLQRLGHQVDVLTPSREDCLKFDAEQPYNIYRYVIPRRVSSLVTLWRTLILYRRNHYDDIFIGHFMTTHALSALVLNKVWGVPFIILSHGNDLRYSITTKVDRWVARLLLDNVPLILANSRFTIGRILQAGYRGPVEVLNPGVDPGQFHPHLDTAEIRQKYGLDGHRVLLTTARLVAVKNVNGVLRALPKVIEHVPDVLYMIEGDGEERERLEALCDELKLRSHVRFLGYIENSKLPALYCASDVFVMPSRELRGSGHTETFGISYIEANACGKPVIGGRSGGVPDAVIDGETGLLVDPHDVDEIAEAIIRLLTDRDLSRSLGENGRRRIERELSWDRAGERLQQHLRRVAT